MQSIIGFVAILVSISAITLPAQALQFDGVIEPYMVIKVGSPVPGVIAEVAVDRGDFVKKDQAVARLQSGVEKALLEVARARAEMESDIKAKKAQLDFAIRKQEWNEQLYRKEFLPFSQMDEVETGRRLAEMQYQEALENKRLAELEYKRALEVVKRLTISSPIDGVVVERFLHPGEYVEDQPILKIAQIDPLNVEVILPVAVYYQIKVGMRAKVIPESPVGGQYVAQVKVVDRVIDAASGTFGVRLEMSNPGYRLPAGLKCKVIFPDKKGKE